MSEKKHTVKIKKGAIKIELDRSELIEIKATPDGVVFNFKNDCVFAVNDMYMPNEYKNAIVTADTAFKTGSLEFDLNKSTNPASVSL